VPLARGPLLKELAAFDAEQRSEIGTGMTEKPLAPTNLAAKKHDAPSVFEPANLLREARRKRGLPDEPVPAVCALDPDGDIVRNLRDAGTAHKAAGWACYHTDMYVTDHAGISIGIVGCAVGAPFAVLVAEQLFVSGCRFLVSITSAGQITPKGPPPYFVLIDRALRDEGTSHHYLPSSTFVEPDRTLADRAFGGLTSLPHVIHRGTSWTTDAPYRETEDGIAAARAHGALAVEMEAAALYAFARARRQPVLCFAHVTNQMARIEGDFEKGEADGTRSSLDVIATSARACGFGPSCG
jgi:uridine phosphorylase